MMLLFFSSLVPYFRQCWYFDPNNDDKDTPLSPLSTTPTTATSRQDPMGHSKKQPRRSRMTNQLTQAVSPFDELLPSSFKKDYHHEDFLNNDDCGGAFPFDELRMILQPNAARKGNRKEEPQMRHDVTDHRGGPVMETREGIPTAITVVWRNPPAPPEEEESSQISIEAMSEARTLTPHPSFEKPPSITATDFHHLYEAARDIADEEDWPSDEDGPRHGCGWMEQLQCGRSTLPVAQKKRFTSVIQQNESLDEFLHGRNNTSAFEI